MYVFNKLEEPVRKMVPQGFLSSLLRMYDYSILQQVKESLYYYNEEQIAKDIKNYISAVTNEIGSVVDCILPKKNFMSPRHFLKPLKSGFCLKVLIKNGVRGCVWMY